MSVETGKFLSLCCIRLALGFWFLFALLWLTRQVSSTNRGRRPSLPRRPLNCLRGTWIAATILYLAHMILAFAYFHEGSHRLAMQHIAERTQAFTGIYWSGGMWFNHAFTLLVLVESCRWFWVPELQLRRPRWIPWVLYGFLVFMMINAGVVFVTGSSRWINLAGLLTLTWVAIRRLKGTGKSTSTPSPP